MERRTFLKLMGASAVATGAAVSTATGYLNGVDPMTHSGWEKEAFTDGQRFDRTPYEVDHMPFNKVGPTKRVELYAETQLRRANFKFAFDIPEEAGVSMDPKDAFSQGPDPAFSRWLASQVDVKNLEATPIPS